MYLRYFSSLSLQRRVEHDRLLRICFGGYDREMVLVADRTDSAGGHRILGVGRLNKSRNREEGEVAVLVADDFQNQGLGTELLRRNIQIAREEKLHRLVAEILRDNIAMEKVFRRLGFSFHVYEQSESTSAVLEL